MGVAASAYVVRLSGDLNGLDDEGYVDGVEQAFVVATDVDGVADAILTTDPTDRFPILLRRALHQHVSASADTEAPFLLQLYTVQQGRIQAQLDLTPNVSLRSTSGATRLDRILERGEGPFDHERFAVSLPPLAPLVAPVLQPGQLLTVRVPDELEDMTDIGLGETEIAL